MPRSEQMESAEFKKVNFWWVNQGKSRGKTFDIERRKGIIAVPKKLPEITTYPQHWKNISELTKGDIIFHYSRKAVRAISIVADNNIEEIKREKDVYEHEKGLAVKVKYFDIEEIDYQNILPHVTEFKKTLPQKYSPIQL